jgi:AcrR family transcriptional regulator
VAPRKYEGSRRRAAAEATRTQILEATRAILGSAEDVGALSMEAVARKAGVARMTVYYQFRSRAGLLDALSDHLAARAGMERMAGVFLAPTREEAVRRFVRAFVALWTVDRGAMRRLRALGVVAPGELAAPRGRDAWRREAAENLLRRFGGPDSRRGEREETVVDLLVLLTSFETFDALATPGRSVEEVTRRIEEWALAGLGPAPPRAPRARPASGPRGGRGAAG